jgi:hypothetical protein
MEWKEGQSMKTKRDQFTLNVVGQALGKKRHLYDTI